MICEFFMFRGYDGAREFQLYSSSAYIYDTAGNETIHIGYVFLSVVAFLLLLCIDAVECYHLGQNIAKKRAKFVQKSCLTKCIVSLDGLG